MENKIHLQITTAAGSVYDKMVNYVRLPLADGDMGILSNHSPVVGSLKEGIVKCTFDADGVEYIVVTGGVVSVANNDVILLARSAELAESIDLARAQAAEKRARQRLEAKDEQINVHRAEASLSRALVREKAYSLVHR